VPFTIDFSNNGRVLEWGATGDGAVATERDDYTPPIESEDGEDRASAFTYFVYYLVNSYSHLVLKHATQLSGMSRTSLAEFLLPRSLSFVIYSNQRTDFNTEISTHSSKRVSVNCWAKSIGEVTTVCTIQSVVVRLYLPQLYVPL
jgi:hypothetical protein